MRPQFGTDRTGEPGPGVKSISAASLNWGSTEMLSLSSVVSSVIPPYCGVSFCHRSQHEMMIPEVPSWVNIDEGAV